MKLDLCVIPMSLSTNDQVELACPVCAARCIFSRHKSLGIFTGLPSWLQVLMLQRLCKDMAWKELEVLTVDKCQGRDKDVVLLSLVRSNEEQNAGNLLKDWRRLNVAITRAKKKLILIGSQKTLRTIPHYAQLLDLMTQKQWVLTLPAM